MEPEAVIAFVLAYLLGSIDFGIYVTRVLGMDIRREGSGNPGASNVLRTAGKGAFAATLAGDIAKGLVAALVGDLWVGEAAGFAAGFAAVVGHCFPVWHGFRGGKGVAAGVGALIWLEPLLGLGLLAAWALIVATTRVASLASLLLAIVYVPALVATGHREWSLVWAGATLALVVARHSSNIRRLITGEESRLPSG